MGSARLAGGTHNGEVRVWDWEDGRTVAGFIASSWQTPA